MNTVQSEAYWDYLKQFDYRITVKFGPTYTAEYQEFSAWCTAHLGVKYKDWFITSNSRGAYTLHARSNKWVTFLTLTWIDYMV